MPLIRKDTNATPAKLDEKLLVSGSATERRATARAISDPAHVDALGAALAKEQDQSVREAILTSLCRIATAESAAVMIPCLRSDDAGVRRSALDALMSIPEAAAAHLQVLLGDTDPDVRLLSCEIVRRLPSKEATELLSDLLDREPVTNVCASAIDVLTEIGGPEALPALRSVGARFPDETFLQFAVKAAIERVSSTSAERA